MTIKKQNIFRTTFIIALTVLTFQLQAQEWKNDKKVNLLFGLTQPLFVDGFNIEGNYIHNRLIFDYSHGVSLDFSQSSLTPELRNQGVTVHMPWTTGFGVGYRFNEWLNLRVEPKWHRFEFYYDDEPQTSENEITSYNTFSLGLGLYANFRPFKNKASFIKGIMVAPSIRFWPTVSSTLDGDSFAYNNKNTLATETIETLDSGLGFTPIIFNISIGYSFDLKKNK